MSHLSSKEIQGKLEETLARLKRDTGLGSDLRVEWHPNLGSNRHGEVKESVIYIYDADEGEAVRTLKHEFWDYHITREIVDPLIQYVNMQKNVIEGLIYKKKERVVQGLSKLL
ncbi:MAG: hypothetical protein U9O89_00280 [Thermoproteota archaeon]|nr:hypothetical protein [Thermoproteota archaeon]